MKTKMNFDISPDPTVAAERQKLLNFQLRLADAERQLQRASDDDDEPRHTAFKFEVDRELGREVPEIAPRLTPDEAARRVRVLQAAIAEQRKAVADAEQKASEHVAREALPQYTAIVDRMAKAFAAAKAATLAEREFRIAMQDADLRYSSVIKTMPFADFVFDTWMAQAQQAYGISA